MLVGHYGVGKTSVKRSLLNEEFQEEWLPTDGVETEDTISVHTSLVKEDGTACTWQKGIAYSRVVLFFMSVMQNPRNINKTISAIALMLVSLRKETGP